MRPTETKESTLRSFGRPLTAVLAGALCAFSLVAVVPAAGADAVSGPAVRITEFSPTGQVARYGIGSGEYVELTNVGDEPAQVNGWSYDSGSDHVLGISLTSLGTIEPGESVIITDLSPTWFRDEWGLKDSVRVISNAQTSTLSAGPDTVTIYDGSDHVVESVSYGAGFMSAGESAWVDAAHLGAQSGTAGWHTSAINDAEASWASRLGSIGSPGASSQGTQAPSDIRDASRPESACDTDDTRWPRPQRKDNPAPYEWPVNSTPRTIDEVCAWATPVADRGLSGLVLDPNDPEVLYALQDTGHLYRLIHSGGDWIRDTDDGWAGGKDLRFPGGGGVPDTEGITVGPEGSLYVTTERDHAVPGTPLDSVLRFDPTAAGTTLVATDQWVLTPDLGLSGADDADMGLDGITYLPDSFLTSNGFKTGENSVYNPAAYPAKAAEGLFAVAIEKTGQVRLFAFDRDHTFTRVADFSSGLVGVMDISFDAELGRIWAHCDDRCLNATALLRIGVDGYFGYDRYYLRPENLPDYGFEGFAVAPAATAKDGVREVLWADDGNRFGHSLWSGTLDADQQLAQVLTPLPVIVGTPAIGAGVLSAQIGTWGPGVAVHYRWMLDAGPLGEEGTEIGADGPLSLSDPTLAGRTVVLVVTGVRSGFRSATVTASTGITDGSLTTRVPQISGLPAVGKTLVARAVGWGPTGVTLAYQWLADGQPIRGATRSTLRLGTAQLGRAISVRVTGIKAGFDDETEQSSSTTRVRAGTIVTHRPVIKGKATVGRRLVARPGGWRADGAAVRYRFQWYVNGHAVRGADRATLVVKRAFRGKRITVKVTGDAAGYAVATRRSPATARAR